jgi:hypothetical protein
MLSAFTKVVASSRIGQRTFRPLNNNRKMKIQLNKTKLFGILVGFALTCHAGAALIITQYIETDSGTTPKGIELVNTGATTIDFSVTNLVVLKGTNGAAPTSDFSLATGSLASGGVMVIGTSDMGTYLDTTFGIGVIQYHTKAFSFNGDDSLVIELDGVTQDVFGTPGSDPGTAWTVGGVSTANQNIELKPGITTGDTDGWADPSERFTTNNTTPSAAGGLAGFGVAPIPEPSSVALLSLGFLTILRRRR